MNKGINCSCSEYVELRTIVLSGRKKKKKKPDTTLPTIIYMTFWQTQKWKHRNQIARVRK